MCVREGWFFRVGGGGGVRIGALNDENGSGTVTTALLWIYSNLPLYFLHNKIL